MIENAKLPEFIAFSYNSDQELTLAVTRVEAFFRPSQAMADTAKKNFSWGKFGLDRAKSAAYERCRFAGLAHAELATDSAWVREGGKHGNDDYDSAPPPPP